ncbi:MAG: alanine--glyoxylate aminotransferase family protein [Cyclobacteriaceae bacterium]
MSLISFYPGPSRINSQVPRFIEEAYEQGILSMNHRSDEFMNLMSSTKKSLSDKLNIPSDYQIVFVSSATECWEVFAQSCTQGTSQHLYNGAFGEKWAKVAESIGRNTIRTQFDLNETIPYNTISADAEWICLTHCETSNGSYIDDNTLRKVHEQAAETLIAVDATATMGGLNIDFRLADYWFASVQKCFGLPAGLAVLIVSDRAVKKATAIGEMNHYNSLLNMLAHSGNNQTHYTPNALNIFLLFKTLSKSKGIEKIEEKLRERMNRYELLIAQHSNIKWLLDNPALRSPTVLAITHHAVDDLKLAAKQNGLVLGNGYGQWKHNSFRIANYPSIKKKEIDRLETFLMSFKS